MKRKFEMQAYANRTGYGVTLKIDDKEFSVAATVANGDTVGSTYRQFSRLLTEAYGNIERNTEYTDILDAKESVYNTICALNHLVKVNAGD